jgi:hypothetical protein
MSQHPKSEQADIALLLEGTFPYVSGGVSSWINQIIRAFPEYTYAIIFLGSQSRDYPKFKYELPANVVHFEQHFLYDHLSATDLPRARGRPGHVRHPARHHRHDAPGQYRYGLSIADAARGDPRNAAGRQVPAR